jgi:hypothetical protein
VAHGEDLAVDVRDVDVAVAIPVQLIELIPRGPAG